MEPPERCDEAFAARVRAALAGFERQAAADGPQRRAAVAVAIAEEGSGAALAGIATPAGWSTAPALLLTKRARTLRAHAGQWALPGGRLDEGESAEAAALRELQEEIGLVLGPQQVLGRLDDYVTRSGYAITPVVVWAGAAQALVPNAGEVASIHRIPVRELMRADAPWLNKIPQSPHPVLRMPVGDSWIAAPTAAVLYQFRELCLLGRPTRVAHFEQPVFAWR